MTPSDTPRPNGERSVRGAAATRTRVSPRSTLLIALTLGATLLLAACGQVTPDPEPEPAGMTLTDAGVIVPFDYGPGRDVTLQLVRSGGFDGEVTVDIDASALPAGVTISSTTLTFAPGETGATVTLVSDDTVGATNLNAPVPLAMSATAADHSSAATLSVDVAAVVMTTDDNGEGSLRHLDTVLPDGGSDDLILVSFDPTVFSAPTTIQLASSIDIHQGRHFEGPVNEDSEPLVTIRGADAGNGIIGVKDTIDGQFSNLIFENGRGNTNGGAIHNSGNLTIQNSIIRESEGVRGGGIYNQVGAQLTVRETQITANTADNGGGIYNNGGTVSIFDSVVDANVADTEGGGVYNGGATVAATLHRGELFVSGSQVSGNAAVHGGGIGNTADGDLTVVRSVISDNDVSGDGTSGGGGIDNQGVAIITFSEISDNTAVFGGGINNPGGSELRIAGSTIAANVVTANGGGLFSNGEVAITNGTFANNEAKRGGGLFVSANPASTAVVAFSTFAGNTAGEAGGGIDYSGALTLRGTIVAANSVALGDGPDVYRRGSGDFTSLGYNLIGDSAASGVFGANNLTDVDPLLGELQDNGGDTPTMALADASPAVDHVPQASCLDASGAPLDRDQRGEARPSGSHCDSGAFEVQ